jgi:hypothetical protein
MYRIAMRTVVYDTLTCELTTDRTGNQPGQITHATRLAFHGLILPLCAFSDLLIYDSLTDATA